MKTKILLAGLLCCLASGQAGKPNFTGTWKLNNGKSTQDGPAGRVYTCVVSQSDKTITVATKADGVTNILDGTFPVDPRHVDGKYRITKMDKTYRYTSVYWESGTLTFEILDKDGKKDTSKVLMGLRENWTLSPDGKVMTQFRQTGSITAPGHPVDHKYVFDKQ